MKYHHIYPLLALSSFLLLYPKFIPGTCLMATHWSKDTWKNLNKKCIYHFQQLSPNNSDSWKGRRSLLIFAGISASLILLKSHIDNHSCCEFVSGKALSCPDGRISQCIGWLSYFFHFLFSVVPRDLGWILWGRELMKMSS